MMGNEAEQVAGPQPEILAARGGELCLYPGGERQPPNGALQGEGDMGTSNRPIFQIRRWRAREVK